MLLDTCDRQPLLPKKMHYIGNSESEEGQKAKETEGESSWGWLIQRPRMMETGEHRRKVVGHRSTMLMNEEKKIHNYVNNRQTAHRVSVRTNCSGFCVRQLNGRINKRNLSAVLLKLHRTFYQTFKSDLPARRPYLWNILSTSVLLHWKVFRLPTNTLEFTACGSCELVWFPTLLSFILTWNKQFLTLLTTEGGWYSMT